MATWNHKRTKLGYYIFVFVALFHMLSYVQVHGRSISSDKTMELAKHKGTIKTLQSEDGDEVIDCVDIYKQPAFDHPLLKNHTIQMKPSSYPKGMKVEKFDPNLLQGYIKCPQGTVPIVRAPINNSTKANFSHRKYQTQAIFGALVHEYAQVSALGNYYGASAKLNVWHPATFNGEFSLAQFWVLGGEGAELNSMEAGWISYPGDTKTRLFIFWTNDNYVNSGCYDLKCPGFVQTSNHRLLGAVINPISIYGGKQFDILLIIHKDKQSGNWWLRFQDIDLGYWPTRKGDRHTITEMGNGHFPSEGFKFAAYIRNLAYIESGDFVDAKDLVPFVTNAKCYDVNIPRKNKDWGTHIFFGGPGWNDECP
ncbi:hypothetical protein COLO4_30570 [Corchorus olitorius]|uniref:Neprosin PEP catalytic domain-containing protein n=1 Tax=Corchorus olitorius TaxID=93759 RepID=A0A1R3H7X6_9ROSI|nr:hypothetical protein COLO4_30570 [Corchorus olitorius]